MYNFMNIKSISEMLVKEKGYGYQEVNNFISNKLVWLSNIKDYNSMLPEEVSFSYFKEDIVDKWKDFSDNEMKMTRDIILSELGDPRRCLNLIVEINNNIIGADILKKLDVNIDIFKMVIKKHYNIYNPSFNDYDDFIQYSFIIMKFISQEELVELNKEFFKLDDKNIKKEVSYYKALLSTIVYGMRYAGEYGDKGYSFHGMDKIREYSWCINNDKLIEILNYIVYEGTYIINSNYRSIKELIDSSLRNIYMNSNELDYMRKFYKFFYIDCYWLFEYITDLSYDYISQLDDYQNYSYITKRNDMKIDKSGKIINREILRKQESENGLELIVYESKDIENKVIRYIAKEVKNSNDIKVIIEIEFKYLFDDNIQYIINFNNEEHKLGAKIKYNYDKTINSVFGQVTMNEKNYKNIYSFQEEIESHIKKMNVKKEVLEILYLYIDNMHGDKNMNFRLPFNNDYIFKTIGDKKKNSIKIIITQNPDKSKLNGLFTVNEEFRSNILNIHALLGRNGSGKTSIINLIRNSGMFGSDSEFDEETRYCLIFKMSSTIYWISNNNTIYVDENNEKIKIKKSEIENNKDFMNTSVMFFSNIVNLHDKKNINFNAINKNDFSEGRLQIDLSNQSVYNYQLDSAYNSKYNDAAVKLINFSSKYYNDNNYKQFLTNDRCINAKKNNSEDNEYKFQITVLDNVCIEIMYKNILLDYLNIKARRNKNENLDSSELHNIDMNNIQGILNKKFEFFSEDFKEEYEVIKGVVNDYYQDEKYLRISNNTYDKKSFISEQDIIWRCIELILCKKLFINTNQKKAKEKFKIIINIIFNYYKYKNYISEHDVNVIEEDIVWKCVDEIDKIAMAIDENVFKFELKNGQCLIEMLNKMISELEKIEMNFIFYKINSLSTGQLARLNLFSSLDCYWKQEDITGRINKKNYILILDEAEAFYHPEWQRTFIYDLISFLEFEKKAFNSIQVIISSNSPFLISDLPSENLVFLDKDKKKGKAISGFGQNIHSLLSDTFFMTSTIGEFAKTKINEILKTLNKESVQYLKDNKDDIERKINIIGEPLIRNKLLDILFKKLYTYEEENLEIKRIEDTIKELQLIREKLQNNKNNEGR
ncbi:hypothetical protein [Clostridium beijerinckii]|uniref:hypothetical protein n=1 Tax=Clostridium beijerinckii TaxID=1520 RepID=UPI00242C8349|nr:hypothetical protein [Clostridium beijerinckii]MDG5855367.1 hypothetical protein [Clostridium beijerinckii]